MKAVVFGDLHITERGLAHGQQTKLLLDEMPGIVREENPDVCLLTGDYAGTVGESLHRSTATERNAIFASVAKIANFCPVVAIRGNHDLPGDWATLGLVRAKNRVYYVERPQMIPIGEVDVLALPWPHRQPEEGETPTDVVMQPFGHFEQPSPKRFFIILGHFGTSESQINGRSYPKIVAPTEPVFDLEKIQHVRPDVVVMGHLHEQSAHDIGKGFQVVHTGAMTIGAYGEAQKYACVVQKFQKDVLINFVRVHSRREMYQATLEVGANDTIYSDPFENKWDVRPRVRNLSQALVQTDPPSDWRFELRCKHEPDELPLNRLAIQTTVRDWEARLRQVASFTNNDVHVRAILPKSATLLHNGADAVSAAETTSEKVSRYLQARGETEVIGALGVTNMDEAYSLIMQTIERL